MVRLQALEIALEEAIFHIFIQQTEIEEKIVGYTLFRRSIGDIFEIPREEDESLALS